MDGSQQGKGWDNYHIDASAGAALAGKLGQYAYHEIARYNPVHKVVVFGGGNSKVFLYKHRIKTPFNGLQ